MIIDTPWNTVKALPRLKTAGVKTIIRYYNFSNSSVLPEKRMEKDEADAIHDAGMSIAVVFQQRQNDPGDFTPEKGRSACERAMELAGNVGQPDGSGIYFGVDRDFVKKSQLDAVASYFEGVNEAMEKGLAGNRFAIGVYGSGLVLSTLGKAKLAKLMWLAQSTGWSGFDDFKASKKWHLLQGPVTKVGGHDCDTNEGNGKFGAF
jgi:hypothetical protein